MKIIYLADIRLPTEKAHGLQIMKTCESLAQRGEEVTLLVPNRANKISSDPFAFYQVRPTFRVMRTTTKEFFHFGRLGYLWSAWNFARQARAIIKSQRPDVVYTRDLWSGLFVAFSGQKIIWEIHDQRSALGMGLFLRKACGVIAISNGLKNLLVQKFNFPNSSIAVIPDAVDVAEFAIKESVADCRDKLSLPQDKKIILYTGHLYGWKGADTLAESASMLGEDSLVVIVGGTENDLINFREQYGKSPKILIAGRRPHQEIPYWLKAADVLVLPNSAQEKISRLYTSPMKLFEYLAAGKPIVSSEIPSLVEVLNDKVALFVTPDSPVALARGVNELLASPEQRARMSQSALALAGEYTWDKRAEKIFNFLKLCLR